MIKTKKQMFIVIGAFLLTILLGTVTYAFFNYTRTGTANTIKTGRIAFNSEQGTAINLTNMFPIDVTNGIPDDNTKVGTVTIHVTGDTTYNEGVEYLVSAVNVTNTVGTKSLPISIDVGVSSNTNNDPATTLGTQDDDYFTNRDSASTSIYSVLAKDTISTDDRLVVGYIKSGATGIDGNIVIRAYLDNAKVAITDTYDGTESNNMGTTSNWKSGRTTFTTNEWNSLKSNGVSFQVKVEANEGIWVEELLGAYGDIQARADTTTVINFGEISSNTNGKGLYMLPGTGNDKYPIYYYRGEINDNNVVFGDVCWKMVRTTDTGGIKMIYNGEATVTGSGNNISYDCGDSRPAGRIGKIKREVYLGSSNGYYFADDYEIFSVTDTYIGYKLKSKNNPITQVQITASNAEATIATIAANYPYTCMDVDPDGGCPDLYKIDSFARDTYANGYIAARITSLGIGQFNANQNSISDVGYMYNKRYELNFSRNMINDAIYAKKVEWNGTNYLLVDDTPGVASTNKTLDSQHHYSCFTANTSSCDILYYVFNYWQYSGTKSYIMLTNGETVEDAIYKMIGEGSNETKLRNAEYKINNTDSSIKADIEKWFKENLTNEIDSSKINYVKYLEDTTYCNDRSVSNLGGFNPNNDLGFIKFKTMDRVYNNNWYSTTNIPVLTCSNITDQFRVNNNLAKLNYPVGLLTADEVIMAGASGNRDNSNRKYYLYNFDSFWLMNPGSNSNERAVMLYAYNPGYLYTDDGTQAYRSYRPVVSLKLGTEFETGGEGTPTNPYVVKYN